MNDECETLLTVLNSRVAVLQSTQGQLNNAVATLNTVMNNYTGSWADQQAQQAAYAEVWRLSAQVGEFQQQVNESLEQLKQSQCM